MPLSSNPPLGDTAIEGDGDEVSVTGEADEEELIPNELVTFVDAVIVADEDEESELSRVGVVEEDVVGDGANDRDAEIEDDPKGVPVFVNDARGESVPNVDTDEEMLVVGECVTETLDVGVGSSEIEIVERGEVEGKLDDDELRVSEELADVLMLTRELTLVVTLPDTLRVGLPLMLP